MKIDYPDNFSLDTLNNTFLWRYIGFEKLKDLVSSEQIYFTRLDKFPDGLEGITGKCVSLKAINQSNPLTIENVNKKFDDFVQTQMIKNDQTRRSDYLKDLSNSQQTQFASCWYLGDDESKYMWELYAKMDGVAIKFQARELTDVIILSAQNYTNSNFDLFFFGPVVYKNIWPFDPHEKFDGKFNALKKNKCYSNESEFRFLTSIKISLKGKIGYLKLPIGKLTSFKLEVITNPSMDNDKKEKIKKLLSSSGLLACLRSSKINYGC